MLQEIHSGLNLSSEDDDDEFGIFSIKFSTDGRELVAGTSDCSICVYDLGAEKLSLRIPAHMVLYYLLLQLVSINGQVDKLLKFMKMLTDKLSLRIPVHMVLYYLLLQLVSSNGKSINFLNL